MPLVAIAKGSERVAEVAARFTLDAMPGKQMSIDADVRSGLIDSSKARELRRKLERESQFYGAMDGAMKFVIVPQTGSHRIRGPDSALRMRSWEALFGMVISQSEQ